MGGPKLASRLTMGRESPCRLAELVRLAHNGVRGGSLTGLIYSIVKSTGIACNLSTPLTE